MDQLDHQQKELQKRLELIRQLKRNPALSQLHQKINVVTQENKKLHTRVSQLEVLLNKGQMRNRDEDRKRLKNMERSIEQLQEKLEKQEQFILVKKQEEIIKNQQAEKFREKIQELEQKVKNQVQWENEDLDSKANFDSKYIYKVYSSSYSGGGILVTWNWISKLQWSHGSTVHTVQANNKRRGAHGYPIQRILKKKMQSL